MKFVLIGIFLSLNAFGNCKYELETEVQGCLYGLSKERALLILERQLYKRGYLKAAPSERGDLRVNLEFSCTEEGLGNIFEARAIIRTENTKRFDFKTFSHVAIGVFDMRVEKRAIKRAVNKLSLCQ